MDVPTTNTKGGASHGRITMDKNSKSGGRIWSETREPPSGRERMDVLRSPSRLIKPVLPEGVCSTMGQLAAAPYGLIPNEPWLMGRGERRVRVLYSDGSSLICNATGVARSGECGSQHGPLQRRQAAPNAVWFSGIDCVLTALSEHRACTAHRFCMCFVSGSSRSGTGKEDRRVHSAARPVKLPVPR
jgi:hypothetical protein